MILIGFPYISKLFYFLYLGNWQFLTDRLLPYQVNNATARVQTKKPPAVPNGKCLHFSYYYGHFIKP